MEPSETFRFRKPPTVRDLARAADVSLATIDRVLNNRPGVRRSTIERVNEAARRIDFKRDLSAVNLARRRVYSFLLLLPKGDNLFMQSLEQEARAYAQHQDSTRVALTVRHVQPFDSDDLVRALQAVDASHFAGVAVVAVDTPQVSAALNQLARQGVHVVTLVSDVPSAKREHFAGIDNDAAGRTAASLLGRFCASSTTGKLVTLAGSMLVRDHLERWQGFEQVMRREYPQHELLPVLECFDDNQRAHDLLSQCLREHPDVIGVYNTAGGIRGVLGALKENRMEHQQHRFAIAHDLNDYTRQALLDSSLDAVIHQNPGREARSAMRVLRCLCDGTPLLAEQERIGIEVIMRDNLPL